MDKRDYFIKAVNAGLYMSRRWIVSAFCVLKNRPVVNEGEQYQYKLIKTDDDKLAFLDLVDGKYVPITIDNSDVNKSLFMAKEAFDIKAGELPILEEDLNTTYGIVIGNMCILHYPFGNMFKFINGEIGDIVDTRVSELLTDDVKDVSEEKPERIYVRQYLLYGEACAFLSNLSPIFASSGSIKAMTVDPSVLKLRDELFEKNKDRLHDRTVQALIEEEVVRADKASFKGDDAEDFLISGKSFNPTRKKALISIGGSSGFGDPSNAKFIKTSLREKWKVEDIPTHANEARSGSYFRGKETQFGGADVKIAYRMAMNSKVAEDFCNTKTGKSYIVDESNTKFFVNLYRLTGNGPELITKENIKQHVGKVITIHNPQTCKTSASSYCAVCVGSVYSKLPKGIPSVVAGIGDVYMYDKMKRMHGKAMVTVRIKLYKLI